MKCGAQTLVEPQIGPALITPVRHINTIMRSLTLARSVTLPADLDVSRITDLALGPAGRLYATTNYDGWITAWNISGTNLAQIDRDDHAAALSAGAMPGLTFVARNGEAALLSGGFNGGRMALRPLTSDGRFESPVNLGNDSLFAGPLIQPGAVQLTNGLTAVYGGIVDSGGIARMTFAANGTLASTTITPANAISAMTSGLVEGIRYLFTASADDNSVSALQIGSTGTLSLTGSVTRDQGLWASVPTALASAVIDGKTYLVLAAAGSNSLTVLQVGNTGTLGVVDHIIDDLTTRFAGATVVETIRHDGLTYVITGGADDGISIFALLPGGRLVPRAHIADTPAMTLANISAIAVQSQGTGLDLFVASASEPGLTRLRYDAGHAQLIAGTAAADTLQGAGGDDILFDGAGSDTLRGNAGADTFVLARDGAVDRIVDFTPGQDTIDLSGWQGLRSVNQLFFDSTSTGITITYGNEVLIIRSANGQTIAASAFSDTDLLGAARIPQVIAPGDPGPVTAPPLLPARPVLNTPETPQPPPESGIERIGTSADDALFGTSFDDILYGLGGRDTISGNAGADTIYGGGDSDRLMGGAGNDLLAGGAGRDDRWIMTTPAGSSNADILYGDSGNDRIWGHAGADRLWGGPGNDILWGGAGRDTFVFTAGQDRFGDVSATVDTVLLDERLWSGTLSALDIVNRFGTLDNGDAILNFGNGNILTVDDIGSLTALSQTIDFL